MVFRVDRSYPPGTTMLLMWTGSTLGVAVSYLQDMLRLRKGGVLGFSKMRNTPTHREQSCTLLSGDADHFDGIGLCLDRTF